MPHRSRTTETGCDSPVTISIPSTCGSSAEVRRGRDAGWLHATVSATGSTKLERRTMGLKDTLLAEFDHEMGTTRRVLERLPDARFDWKPHDKSMSLGGLATHLSNLP